MVILQTAHIPKEGERSKNDGEFTTLSLVCALTVLAVDAQGVFRAT